jgi:hypothetical protein
VAGAVIEALGWIVSHRGLLGVAAQLIGNANRDCVVATMDRICPSATRDEN